MAVWGVPHVGVVPPSATAPALSMVGRCMMKEVKKIDFDDRPEAFTAFVIMIMIARSYSISTGLAFGFISFTVIKLVSGRFNEIRNAMWIITLLSLLFLTMDQLPALIDYIKEGMGLNNIRQTPIIP